MRSVSVLGSTGSIGTQTLEVAEHLGFRVEALAAGRNVLLIEKQARKFLPAIVALYDESSALELKSRLSDTSVKVLSGEEGVCECAAFYKSDIIVNAVTGSWGLMPTMAALISGKTLALANKESLVMAGDTVMKTASEMKTDILPVDSEHSAIFQCLRAGRPGEISKIWLTASGGPFFGKKSDELEKVTPRMALAHPSWNMGERITVDSSTLINKGFEIIEARWLFGTEPDRIKVLVHPQSIIHSMVKFCDGNVIAQLADPDMKRPIQYALTWPERKTAASGFDLASCRPLEFYEPDNETFKGIRLALDAYYKGGNACAVLNGADQAAVRAFLNGRIGFLDIYRIIERTLSDIKYIASPSVAQILESCGEAEKYAEKLLED